ncbi:MAG: DUF4203 domain-containing protein [Anaerolineae bacterium]|nr:DUF4203 domain-containing protein [Anaerolineae bacterium]
MLTPLVNFFIGLAALLFGRKLFWLFVAVAGFVLGVMITPTLLPSQPEWVVLLVALGLGLGGAVLALVIQEVAVAVAGFIFGGYALLAVVAAIGIVLGQWSWIIFIIGGVIGALLVLALFDPALIGLSALVGANLIMGMIHLAPLLNLVLFVVLFIVGVVFQIGLLRREPLDQRRIAYR